MRFVMLGIVFWLAVCDIASAQAVRLAEKVAQAAFRQEVKQAGQRIVFGESDDVVRLLASRLPAAADEVALARRFSQLQGVDDSLRAEFRSLPLAERQLAVELGEGAQRVLHRVPPAEAVALLNRLEAGGLAQARTYGDFVVDGAGWLSSDDVLPSLAAKKLTRKEAEAIAKAIGIKAATETIPPEQIIPLWRSVIRKTGDGSGRFWKTYIEPHQGKWVAGGLLATYLAMPEAFHDGLGNLTEFGVRKLTELGISVGVAAGRGAVGGPIDAFKKHYEDDPIRTLLGVGLLLLLILLAVPPIRKPVFRWIGRAWKTSTPPSPKRRDRQRHEPLRE